MQEKTIYVDGTVIAHGANPKLVGKNLIGLKDPNGKPFIQMITDVARSKGKGWTDSYVFRNPTTDMSGLLVRLGAGAAAGRPRRQMQDRPAGPGIDGELPGRVARAQNP